MALPDTARVTGGFGRDADAARSPISKLSCGQVRDCPGLQLPSCQPHGRILPGLWVTTVLGGRQDQEEHSPPGKEPPAASTTTSRHRAKQALADGLQGHADNAGITPLHRARGLLTALPDVAGGQEKLFHRPSVAALPPSPAGNQTCPGSRQRLDEVPSRPLTCEDSFAWV